MELNRTLRWADKITYNGNFILLKNTGDKVMGPEVDIAADTYEYAVGIFDKPLKVCNL